MTRTPIPDTVLSREFTDAVQDALGVRGGFTPPAISGTFTGQIVDPAAFAAYVNKLLYGDPTAVKPVGVLHNVQIHKPNLTAIANAALADSFPRKWKVSCPGLA